MAVLVRWQVVLVFLSSPVALCCPSWGEEGSFLLSLSVLFFASGGSSHGRTGFVLCLGPCDDHVRPFSLSLSQLERTRAVHVTSHAIEQAIQAGGAGLTTDLNSPSLFMRHTYPRARLRGEQAICFLWYQHCDVSWFVYVAAVYVNTLAIVW